MPTTYYPLLEIHAIKIYQLRQYHETKRDENLYFKKQEDIFNLPQQKHQNK